LRRSTLATPSLLLLGFVAAAASLSACASPDPYGDALRMDLNRVVLYRSGVGYFERTGKTDSDTLRIKCRKDQVDDILKSLTIVDRSSGQAVSVSMPLDPQSWANAALATLAPGQGNIASVMDALRGTTVTLTTRRGDATGRILMVELIEDVQEGVEKSDYRVSLLDGDEIHVVMLGDVKSLTFHDQELAMQLNRSLDASAGEGMFQQVEVMVKLSGKDTHDLQLSYVVSAPMWKPTYRVVLPEDPKGKALLQGWAVVDNTSGEDWADVKLSLTSGAPIAFRYDLHSPRDISRPDMSSRGSSKRAAVAMGETTIAPEAALAMAPPPPAPSAPREEMARRADKKSKSRPMPKTAGGAGGGAGRGGYAFDDDMAADEMMEAEEKMDSGIDMEALARSTATQTRAKRVSGLTQFDLGSRVTVPDGSSTMVAILNTPVEAEQVFLFRPGGAGSGYENNPYRVVRFDNATPFVLEPGPISIYAGGSFVGEGISETIATNTRATIPFAVEPAIVVTGAVTSNATDNNLVKIQQGTLTVERFSRQVTTWTIRGPRQDADYKVLIRQSRLGGAYAIKDAPKATEELPDAYLLPVEVPAGKTEVTFEVIEQTPVRTTISIYSGEATRLLDTLLAVDNLDASARAKLKPIVERRKEIADIDTKISNLRERKQELDQRADQTRQNLEAIKKDPAATALRSRLSKKLEDFTKEGDLLGRQIVELTSQRLEKKIELDEALEKFSFETPETPKK